MPEENAPKSANDMTDAEYQAAKAALIRGVRPPASASDGQPKSANDMTEAEYRAAKHQVLRAAARRGL